MQKEGTSPGCVLGIVGLVLFFIGVLGGVGGIANQIAGAAGGFIALFCLGGGILLGICGLVVNSASSKATPSVSHPKPAIRNTEIPSTLFKQQDWLQALLQNQPPLDTTTKASPETTHIEQWNRPPLDTTTKAGPESTQGGNPSSSILSGPSTGTQAPASGIVGGGSPGGGESNVSSGGD